MVDFTSDATGTDEAISPAGSRSKFVAEYTQIPDRDRPVTNSDHSLPQTGLNGQRPRFIDGSTVYKTSELLSKGIIGGAGGLTARPITQMIGNLSAHGDGLVVGGRGAMANAKTAFIYTLGTGAVLSLDEQLRQRAYGKNSPSLETSSLTVPLSMALGRGFVGKAGLTTASLIAGHVADNTMPFANLVPEPLKHFTGTDAAALGLAIAVPAKSKLVRAGLIGAAWLTSNLADATLTGLSTSNVEKKALDSAAVDKRERSLQSMEKTVADYKQVGQTDPLILESALGKTLIDGMQGYGKMTADDKLEIHRHATALAQSVGETRLEKGTRLSAMVTQRSAYILEGHNLDIGGDALSILYLASEGTKGSKFFTESLMNTKVRGKVVNQQELQDLNLAEQKLDSLRKVILGKHDMEKALTELTDFIHKGKYSNGVTFNKELVFHKTFVEDLNKNLGNQMPHLTDTISHPHAPVLVAKLLRDQALAKLALANHKIENSDDPTGAGLVLFGSEQGRQETLPGMKTPKGFDGVIDSLKLAERLAPDNPDLPELKAIAKRLAERLGRGSEYETL